MSLGTVARLLAAGLCFLGGSIYVAEAFGWLDTEKREPTAELPAEAAA